MSQHNKSEYRVKPFKMIAQSFGMLVCGFFVLYMVGEGIPEIINGKGGSLAAFMPLIAIPIAGYAITWFRIQTGAILMIAGSLLLIVYFLLKGEAGMAALFGLPFLAAGALYELYLQKRKKLLQH